MFRLPPVSANSKLEKILTHFNCPCLSLSFTDFQQHSKLSTATRAVKVGCTCDIEHSGKFLFVCSSIARMSSLFFFLWFRYLQLGASLRQTAPSTKQLGRVIEEISATKPSHLVKERYNGVLFSGRGSITQPLD